MDAPLAGLAQWKLPDDDDPTALMKAAATIGDKLTQYASSVLNLLSSHMLPPGLIDPSSVDEAFAQWKATATKHLFRGLVHLHQLEVIVVRDRQLNIWLDAPMVPIASCAYTH